MTMFDKDGKRIKPDEKVETVKKKAEKKDKK